MALKFVPPPGTIVLCDYSKGGFIEPEMTKRRPAVVVSPRLRRRDNLCAVVPLSGSAPERDDPFVIRLEFLPPLPEPFLGAVFWAKCDMLATVSLNRLDLFRAPGGRDDAGKRRYLQLRLKQNDLDEVLRGVLYGIGLGHLTLTP